MTSHAMLHASQRRQLGLLGMILLLVSLGVLFAGSLVGYLVIRTTSSHAPQAGSITLPLSLWFSTLLILGASACIHQAVQHVRLERQRRFRQSLFAAMLLVLAFTLVQVPGLLSLLGTHESLREQQVHLYGLIFVLILLHALHVLGGVVSLIVVCIKALKHQYDHESHEGVRYAAIYLHFLDVVWLAMFFVMLATR